MQEQTRERRALLVGVSDYHPGAEVTGLKSPERDVRDLAKALSINEGGLFSIEPTLHNPQKKDLQMALERLFSKASGGESVLFYFSGHGKLGRDGNLYLCTSDTVADYLRSTSVGLRWLREILDTSQPDLQVIIILDCCYSGAAKGAMKSDLPSVLKTDLGAGKGKYLVTSSSAIQPSMELPDDEHSLFTKWLILGLGDENADDNADGWVTLDELFRFVEENVRREFPEQHPKHFGFETTGEPVVMARCEHHRGSRPLASKRLTSLKPLHRLLSNGNIIPFLGSGIYGSESLSAFSLANALADEIGEDAKAGMAGQELDCLASVAEYFYRVYGGREGGRDHLLGVLREILDRQTETSRSNAVHELVLGLPLPSLVVSTTYDWVLERELEQGGQPFTLISHVISSEDGEHDGKVLVLRSPAAEEAEIELCLADEVLIDDEDRVIYKVLGSPYLNDRAQREGVLDTVVVTETDLMKFLGRLENQHTRPPEAFSLPFQTRKLLFLGYNLNVWQFRLVGLVFGKDGVYRTQADTYAVRQSTSPIEERFWRELGANLIHTDAQSVAAALLELQPLLHRGV